MKEYQNIVEDEKKIILNDLNHQKKLVDEGSITLEEKDKEMAEQKEKFESEIKKKKAKYHKKVQQLKETEADFADTKSYLEEVEKNLEKAKSDVIELNSGLAQLKSDSEKSKTDLENSQADLIKTQEKLQELKEKYKNLSVEKKELDEKNEFLFNKIKHFSLSKEPQLNAYDLIINIDSLMSNEFGWEITSSNSYEPEKYKENEYTIVGFVGRENIGKTYVLNKLCEQALPSGTNVNTQGLSIKYFENYICMDSAGLQVPVYYYDEKLLNRFAIKADDLKENEDIRYKMINDRTLTDMFIQDFILDVCQIIVIVVGQLSQNDQKFIERITNKYKSKKRIIILHNFSNLYSREDVEKRIQKDIFSAFRVIEIAIPNTNLKQYVEEPTKKKNLNGEFEVDHRKNIMHLVLGMDWGESGEYYNEKTLEFIKKVIDADAEKSQFDLKVKMQEFFEENFRNYLQFKKLPKNPVKLNLEQTDKEVLKIKSEEQFEVSNPIFNSLGGLIPVVFQIIEKKDKYICFIEMADIIKESVEIDINARKSEFCILHIKAEKKINGLVFEENENVVGNRNSGSVYCKVPLGCTSSQVKRKEFKMEYFDGVMMVEIPKQLDQEETL